MEKPKEHFPDKDIEEGEMLTHEINVNNQTEKHDDKQPTTILQTPLLKKKSNNDTTDLEDDEKLCDYTKKLKPDALCRQTKKLCQY